MTKNADAPAERPLFWMGSSRKDIRALPREVQVEIGHALNEVQQGFRPYGAKPLKGFSGASVLEISEDFDTNTYRAIYTVQFAEAVYVLHVFQKKAKRGIATPQADLELIRRRLREAQEDYQTRVLSKGQA